MDCLGCLILVVLLSGSCVVGHPLHAFLSVSGRLSAVRRVKEGTSSIPPQSGFYERWQSDSKECYFLSV